MDAVFVTPNNPKNIYQELSNNYSAIEPPTWSLLLAESCRNIGFKVNIIDALAENLSDEDVKKRIIEIIPI